MPVGHYCNRIAFWNKDLGSLESEPLESLAISLPVQGGASEGASVWAESSVMPVSPQRSLK